VPVEGLVIKLSPAGRYNTTDAEGNFKFHNVRGGRHEVMLDVAGSPPDLVVVGPHVLQIEVKIGQDAAPLFFRVELQKREKPVRRIQLN
jgi:hypothetical protein